LGCLKRLQPEHRSGHALDGSLILFRHSSYGLYLTTQRVMGE
jgi:hypothetical protein